MSMPEFPMWLVKALAAIAMIYVAVVGVLYLAQTWLIFPTHLVPEIGTPLPPGAERLEIATPDGEQLYGARIPATPPAGTDKLLVLGFGGNAWNADSDAVFLRELFPAAEIVVFHHRGYAPSTGRPSARALLADALLIHDAATARAGPAKVIAVGFSIGSGVAAYLASERPLAGLILVTPFDSLAAVARDQYPWAPVGLLLRHRIPTADFVRGRATPTAILAAERDTLVPPPRTEALRRAVPNLVFDRTIAGTGHNDIYHHPAFRRAMAEALALLARQGAPVVGQ